ncbi:hypothetical protein QOZ88_01365 [Blastococcus sp. BMG 814]|uniref:ABC transporter n=1 Tax=Blastococcus carthaginiensis TaxID=3050034 RepID=A0ABT9I6S4_9ACTN|nr:hypothetical protein [Blastococcus carthaginiensis]MDP5181277.1 hypothetical protein [Blastococcus carthaginiensis]
MGTLSGGERQSVAIALAHELERPGGQCGVVGQAAGVDIPIAARRSPSVLSAARRGHRVLPL